MSIQVTIQIIHPGWIMAQMTGSDVVFQASLRRSNPARLSSPGPQTYRPYRYRDIQGKYTATAARAVAPHEREQAQAQGNNRYQYQYQYPSMHAAAAAAYPPDDTQQLPPLGAVMVVAGHCLQWLLW